MLRFQVATSLHFKFRAFCLVVLLSLIAHSDATSVWELPEFFFISVSYENFQYDCGSDSWHSAVSVAELTIYI